MTRQELEEYCKKYKDDIFVRVRVEELKWESRALSELSPEEQEKWLDKWDTTNFLPHRINR